MADANIKLLDALKTILKMEALAGALYVGLIIIVLIIGTVVGSATLLPNLDNDTINNITSFKADAYNAVGVLTDSALYVFGLVTLVVLLIVFKDYINPSEAKGKKKGGSKMF